MEPSSMIGKDVSHYRIVEKLGQGAMGEVYLATDSTLGRQVALKFLPEAFSSDGDMLARFEREARLLASLNHPNIAIVHGLEVFEGGRFIVMELAEGKTLAEKISRARLGVTEALAICRQIAEGLEAAHERGIIHRDLKPSNVMVSSSGKVKILDFGLARTVAGGEASADPSQAATVIGEMTRPGTVLGTAPYMSPEQAMGKPVDKRTDIWAFGCVLYECLTLQKAFPGKYMAEVVSAVLGRDPDWAALPAATPGSIHTVLRRCLRKDPQARLRDIGDARIEIEEGGVVPAAPAPTARRFVRLTVVACAVAAVLAGLAFGPRIWESPPPAPVEPTVISTVKIAPGHNLVGVPNFDHYDWPARTGFTFSGDGEFVVYSAIAQADSGSRPQLFLRRLDQAEATPIGGTEGGLAPFLSPDDQWVGFRVGNELKKVEVAGGVAAVLCEAGIVFGASWGPTGEVAFSERASGLSLISPGGGLRRTLTVPDPPQEYAHYLPFWLPGGKQLLFTILKNAMDRRPSIAVLQLDSGQWRILLEDAADARYLPTGHLVFMRRGILMATGFNLGTLEIVGEPIALVEDVRQAFLPSNVGHSTCGQFTFSQNGRLLYARGGIDPDRKSMLVWVDLGGAEQPVTETRLPYFAPRLSPDGRRIAYFILGSDRHIWVYDLISGIHSQLTQGEGETWPVWTPDGGRIAFAKSGAFGDSELCWKAFDGSAEMQRILDGNEGVQAVPSSWSADGAYLAMLEMAEDSIVGISVWEAATGNLMPFLSGRLGYGFPEFSPDGRLIAYTNYESGRSEVYIQPFPGKEWKRQVSSEGGTQPMWSRDGRRLFYRANPGQVWAVDVSVEGEVSIGKPQLLFANSDYQGTSPVRCWDLSLDSQRFLMVKRERREPDPVRELVLVQNWFAEVTRLVPSGSIGE